MFHPSGPRSTLPAACDTVESVRADLPQLLTLICPACRRLSERGRELYTLSLEQTLRQSPAPPGNPPLVPEIEEGILRCANPACGERYPIVCGIPILLPPRARVDAGASLGGLAVGQLAALASLSPETAALLALSGPDDAPLPRLLEHLSIYLDAHWGDCATPPSDGPAGSTAGFGGRELFAALAERAEAPVGRAIELGCSVGRGLCELRRGAELVVGVDLHLGALCAARRLLQDGALPYARRIIGRHYAPATIAPAALPPSQSVVLLCGDALDPPLVPQDFERVVACNLLDSVPSPPGLLSVLDGLCRPGGELIIASPYSWQSGVVQEDARLGGADPAAELRRILTSGGAGLLTGLEAAYAIEADRELAWELRRDARSAHTYIVHLLRARKGLPPC